jgi:O-succinylbenzoic acid--CoA ligase
LSTTVFICKKCKNSDAGFSKHSATSLFTAAGLFRLPENTGPRVGIIASSVVSQLHGIFILLARHKQIVMLNPTLSAEQMVQMLSDSRVNTALGDEKAILKLGGRINVLRIPDDFSGSESHDEIDIYETDPFGPGFSVLLFTSGSSGEPKAVPLTFQNLKAAYQNGDAFLHYAKSDCWVQSLPLFHISGFSIFFRALCAGADLVIPSGSSQKDLEDVLYRFPVTHLSIVPTQLQRLLEHKVQPPASLRLSLLGGAPAGRGLVEKSIAAGWKTAKVYGSTETSAFIALLAPEDFVGQENSSGKALPGVEISIDRQEDGLGEILIRSGSVTSGYLNLAAINKEKFSEGKYHTGDIGRIDEKGFLYVRGRKDSIIITGGEKVHPSSVEKAILATGRVKSCLVAGIPDIEWGQIVVCGLVFHEGEELSIPAFKNELKGLLAPFQIPKKILVLKEMPFDNTGKLRRAELLRLFHETD